YNIIEDEKIKQLSKEEITLDSSRPLFIMAGSFLKVKGFERAVEVYSKLRDDGFDFSVIIMGMGYQRSSVEKVIQDTNMSDRITLMEYQSNPYKYMANADAYVCSSYAEGYSSTVTESVILGTPVITTECSGMHEIFGDRECGIICENSEEGLYQAIKKVLVNPDLLKKYKKEAEIRSNDFKKEVLVKNIENLFETI
ncbi:MAG: glycosyltransferase, partial [Ruminococcus sp.]|nr:glycosyltransferase [Candidatus Copronaster equi]